MESRWAALGLALALATACKPGSAPEPEIPAAQAAAPASAAAAAPAAAPPSVAATALPAAVAGLKGATCEPNPSGGVQTCRAGDYRISVYPKPCAASDGLYGNIRSESGAAVTLYDAFAPQAGQPVAKVQNRQFVCEQARAGRDDDNDEWFYVVAVPVGDVPACKGGDTCNDPGNLKTEWIKPASGRPCAADSAGVFAGDCAAGWVAAKDYQDYPMGLED